MSGKHRRCYVEEFSACHSISRMDSIDQIAPTAI